MICDSDFLKSLLPLKPNTIYSFNVASDSQFIGHVHNNGGLLKLHDFVKKFGKEMKDEIIKTLEAMPNIGQHEDGDYVMSDKKQIRVVKEVKKNCGCGKDPCKTFGNLTEAEFKERYDHRHMSEATYEDGSLVEEGFSFVEPMNEDELEFVMSPEEDDDDNAELKEEAVCDI